MKSMSQSRGAAIIISNIYSNLFPLPKNKPNEAQNIESPNSHAKCFRDNIIRTMVPALIVPAIAIGPEYLFRHFQFTPDANISTFALRSAMLNARQFSKSLNLSRSLAMLARIYPLAVVQSSIKVTCYRYGSSEIVPSMQSSFDHASNVFPTPVLYHTVFKIGAASLFESVLTHLFGISYSWRANKLMYPDYDKPEIKCFRDACLAMRPGFILRFVRNTFGNGTVCSSWILKKSLEDNGLSKDESSFVAALILGVPMGVLGTGLSTWYEHQVKEVQKSTFNYPAIQEVFCNLYNKHGIKGFINTKSCLIAAAITVIANTTLLEANDFAEKIIKALDRYFIQGLPYSNQIEVTLKNNAQHTLFSPSHRHYTDITKKHRGHSKNTIGADIENENKSPEIVNGFIDSDEYRLCMKQ